MIMNRADEGRWGLVEKLKMVPRAGAVHGIIQLLDFVSPTVKNLVIDAPVKHVFDEQWSPEIYETLDYKLLDCDITFSRLTDLRLAPRSFRHAFFVNRLIDMAPAITAIDIDLTHCTDDDISTDEPAIPDVPYIVKTNSSIKRMRIVFDDGNGYDD